VIALDTSAKGYSIKEAAAALGLSENAVRKRIKAGKLQADMVDGPRGPEYRVWLEDNSLAGPQSSLAMPEGPSDEARGALMEAVRSVVGESLALQQASLAFTIEEQGRATVDAVRAIVDEGRADAAVVGALASRVEQMQAALASVAADRSEVEELRAEVARLRRRRWWNPRTW
jgi:hypothetical protein